MEIKSCNIGMGAITPIGNNVETFSGTTLRQEFLE